MHNLEPKPYMNSTQKSENVAYVDAADYKGRDATAFVVVDRREIILLLA